MTLLFSKHPNVTIAVFDCYKEIYFSATIKSEGKTHNLLNLIKGANLTEITCIEELMKKCLEANIFEMEVFKNLWIYYTKPNTSWTTKATT